jgi:hypothetical protein
VSKTIRIGGASGFWGDSMIAAPQLLAGGKLDYLVFDYLAEITMSIMARARAQSPNDGYATDFVTATMRQCLPEIARQKVKVISNAGGVNPSACAAALEALIAQLGLNLKVATVTGDDVMPLIADLRARGIKEMFSGASIPAELMSANAYLGAFPIARALDHGADIVVTGRGVDSAVTLGACIHAFGWKDTDYDRLAGGSLAGHIIECGAQATGGLFTDWQLCEGWENIGYPIAEVSADGSFTVGKPESTGGIVLPATVAEQIVYEIGDPQAYILPDVVCDFSQVHIERAGDNLVRVANAKGSPPTDTYKVSATYQDGFRVGLYLTIAGIDADGKARKTADAILKRCRAMLRARNMADFKETNVELIGAESGYGANRRVGALREVILKARGETRRSESACHAAARGDVVRHVDVAGHDGHGRQPPEAVAHRAVVFVPAAEIRADTASAHGRRDMGCTGGAGRPVRCRRNRAARWPNAGNANAHDRCAADSACLGAQWRQRQQCEYRHSRARAGLIFLISARR